MLVRQFVELGEERGAHSVELPVLPEDLHARVVSFHDGFQAAVCIWR